MYLTIIFNYNIKINNNNNQNMYIQIIVYVKHFFLALLDASVQNIAE